MENAVRQNLRHNYTVNILDGAFFGMALGMASFTTIIPLFISTLTTSATLIGLIPAIHTMGWQLPQLFSAKKLSRFTYFRGYVSFITAQERIPYLGLALIAWFLPKIQASTALWICFVLLIWQGIGSGLTANAWQNMIGKVIPADILATFFGVQSAAANLLASLGSIIAGLLLTRFAGSSGFAYSFLIAFGFMVISWIFLSMTREEHSPALYSSDIEMPLWQNIKKILRENDNFRWFLIARVLSNFGLMAFSFYTVYAVRYHGMNEVTAGIMASVLLMSQVIANPLLGWLSDRSSRKTVMMTGALANALSAILAALAPQLSWFFIIFILAGIANTTSWTISLALTMDFGSEIERPTYIGLANTLQAPAVIIAPLVGGWLADHFGYPSTFFCATIFGLVSAGLYLFRVKDPIRQPLYSDPSQFA
jgi:MFS family permease